MSYLHINRGFMEFVNRDACTDEELQTFQFVHTH